MNIFFSSGAKMPKNSTNYYSEFLEGSDFSDRHRKLLRLCLPEISKAEKKASHTKFWNNALTTVTALGGAAVAALGSLTITGDAGNFVHWSIFGLGLCVTLCGIVAGRFNFGKRTQVYQTVVLKIKEIWVDFFFSFDSKADEKAQSEAVKEFMMNLNKLLGNFSKMDFVEVSDEKTTNQDEIKKQSGAQPTSGT